MPTKEQRVFRISVLEKLSSPEDLDQMIRVNDRKGWFVLIGLMGIVIAGIIWGIFGTIPTEMQQTGILLKPNGISSVSTSTAGQVAELDVKDGDPVKQGQLLGKLKTPQGTDVELHSAVNGTVVDLMTNQSALVNAGTELIRIEESNKPLQAIMFVPLADGKKLQPGMQVEITPSTVLPQESGYLLGTIDTVSGFPVTTDSMGALLNSKELVQAFASNGPTVKVEVTLQKDPNNISGLKWSSPSGAHTVITDSTFFRANIILDEQSPISIVFPIFKQNRN